MGVGGVDRRADQPASWFLSRQEIVAASQLGQPTALHQHRRHPLIPQCISRPLHISRRVNGQAAEQPGLMEIGGDQVG